MDFGIADGQAHDGASPAVPSDVRRLKCMTGAMHAGDPWIPDLGAWPDTPRPDMPQQHDTATVQVPSDVYDTFLEGCGGDHQAAESLLRKTLLAPSVAEAVKAAHQHVASNPSDDHFDAAKEGLSRVFCDFFQRANQADAMKMASLHMLALYTLQRKLRREVDGVMGRPAIIRNKAGEQLFFNERTAQFEPVPKTVLIRYGKLERRSSAWTRMGSPCTLTATNFCVSRHLAQRAAVLHTKRRGRTRTPMWTVVPRYRKLQRNTSASFGSSRRMYQ